MRDTKIYWLKMPTGLLEDRNVQTLRSRPEGNRLLVVCLKMLLRSAESGGRLAYTGRMGSFAAEQAYLMGEPEEAVQSICSFLQERNLLIPDADGSHYYFPGIEEMIGSETEAAARMRALRKKRSQEAPHLREEPVPKREIQQEQSEAPSAVNGSRSGTGSSDQLYDSLCSEITVSPFSEHLDHELRLWFRYRDEIKKPYQSEIGMKKFLREIESAAAKWGEVPVCRMMDKSMSRGWQGVFFDELERCSRIPDRLRQMEEWK